MGGDRRGKKNGKLARGPTRQKSRKGTNNGKGEGNEISGSVKSKKTEMNEGCVAWIIF